MTDFAETLKPSREQPAWVLEMYDEAKDIIDDVRSLVELPDDLRRRLDDFHAETFLDSCTTLGPDCACNGCHVGDG
jgi:hypothetical protein